MTNTTLAAGTFFAVKQPDQSGPLLRSRKANPLSGTSTPITPESAQATVQATSPATATKDTPFTNTLGMKFVPVPITGGPTGKQRVLFSLWETRVQDYDLFVKETKRDWRKPDFEQGPTHPAVLVDWDDATVFCVWLTDRERKAGKISTAETYRLPTDHEWSCAVGIGEKEDAARPPSQKSITAQSAFKGIYPWGTSWPPPAGTVNLGGVELRDIPEGELKLPISGLAGYRDDFPRTAPVGSFPADGAGLFDLGGNVREWCADLFSPTMDHRVMRGGCWFLVDSYTTMSAQRASAPVRCSARGAPVLFLSIVGFRVVLAPATSAPPTTTAMPASAPPSSSPWMDALALVDPVKHAQMGSTWARTANGIEWKAGPPSAPAFIASTILLPFTLPRSYTVESDFTCGDDQGTYGICVPVGSGFMTTAWIDGFHLAGFGKVDGKDPDQSGEPGKASPFTLKANQRCTLRIEVRQAPDAVDLQFTINDKLVGRYHGPKEKLSVSTRWLTGSDKTQLILGANKPGTFHSVRIKALEDAKAGGNTTSPPKTPPSPTPSA
jgi:formylglycine-generating enzyme required for sulfatase activity